MLAEQWLHKYGRDRQNRMWQLRVRDAVDMVQALVESDLQWLERTGLRPVLLEASFGLPGSAVPAVRPGGGPSAFAARSTASMWWKRTERPGQWSTITRLPSQLPKRTFWRAEACRFRYTWRRRRRCWGAWATPMSGSWAAVTTLSKRASWKAVSGTKNLPSGAKKGLGALEADEFQVLEQNLAQRAAELHRDITAGRFPPQPSPGPVPIANTGAVAAMTKIDLASKRGWRAMQLSPEQLAATAIDDNLVVNAGAGSGKTTVLTRRYVRLLEEGGLTPEQIVAITFTRKAAREMRKG